MAKTKDLHEEGQQGDVEVFRIPDSIVVCRDHEIQSKAGRLVIAEGELTGHHHSIMVRSQTMMFREDGSGSESKKRTGTARLYRDQSAVRALVAAGELLRHDLAFGFLIVEGGPVTLKHQEHDPIRLLPGRYYIGGQVESAGTDERRVAD